MAVIDVNLVRQDGNADGAAAVRGKGLDEEAKLQLFPLARLDEFLLQLVVALALVRLNEEISDLRRFAAGESRAAMTIGPRQLLRRTTRHEKVSQDTFFDQGHALRRHALIIDLIVPDEFLVADLALRRIVEYGNERRQHRPVHSFDKFTKSRLALSNLTLRQRQPLARQIR